MSKHIKTVFRELRNAIFAPLHQIIPYWGYSWPCYEMGVFFRHLPIIFPAGLTVLLCQGHNSLENPLKGRQFRFY